ncbi:hypothetical protein ISS03_03335 [Patescibacteria group bacterium]|nr:hypothetical protein [Patescibacteria group bacterium]
MADKKINLDSFADPTGLSVSKMNFGLWFVRNRKRMLMVVVIILATLSVATWVNTIYHFSYYFAQGVKEDELAVSEAKNSALTTQDRSVPTDLRVSIVKGIKTDGKVDFVARIDNLNSEYWSHFKYYFTASNFKGEMQAGFVLPGESKYVIQLGQDTTSITNPKLMLEDVAWTRVSKHTYPNWEEFSNDRLNIEPLNINYVHDKLSGLSEKMPLGLLTFQINNKSSFNYWDAYFNIIMYSGGNIVGVNRYIARNFRSGETRNVSMAISSSATSFSKIEIIPEIDITRSDIYMKFK